MSTSNGTDLGRLVSMVQAVLVGQDAIRTELADHGRQLRDLNATVAEHGRMLADHGRQLRDLQATVVDLRSAVGNYHASVLGHGILISELEARVARVERHLSLPPAA